MSEWGSFDARIREIETKRKPSQNRRAVFEVIKASKLRPHPEYEASLYLGPLLDANGMPVCLEYTNDRPNLWFHTKHKDALHAAGLMVERKPAYGADSEGRHAGLKGKGFRDIDAWKLGNLEPDTTRLALDAIGMMSDADGSTKAENYSREEVEAAMDAFDRYRQSGDHGAIFDTFGEPRDYWVRSTRDRPDRVYPSKPIVGFLRGKTQLNGGWGQKTDAAAQLHNAGYIIVDGDGTPVTPPERYKHLIGNADRIRLCARNYYVEPARENGAAEVAIRAGDLGRDMGLRDRHPAICSALGSEEFQRCAQVPPPTNTLPNPSSSTVFTYQIASAEGHKTMSFEPMTAMPATTNLILYGPPGTGKTYATAWEGVFVALVQHAAAAASGIVERCAALRIEDADHQLHHTPRRIELSRLLAGRVRELADQVFVGCAEEVGKLKVLVEQAILVEVADETAKPFVRDLRLANLPGEIDVPQHTPQGVVVLVLETLESLVQFIGDVGMHVIRESIPAGDWRNEEGFGVGRRMICALQGFRF